MLRRLSTKILSLKTDISPRAGESHPKKGGNLLRDRAFVKYGFIKEHQVEFDIMLMCEVLDVSRSGYYDWLRHTPGKLVVANVKLDEEIKSVFMEHKMRYGAPRVTKALQALGKSCSRNRVARRMQHMGLRAIAKAQI